MKDIEENLLLEKISSLCHVEWMNWSKNISRDLNVTVDLLNKNNQYLKEKNFNIERKEELIVMDTLWRTNWRNEGTR